MRKSPAEVTRPKRKLVIFLLVLALPIASAAAGHGPYTTNFPLTENPISESGNWINGGTAGLDWNNVRTTPGLAFGTMDGNQGPPQQYADSTALLTGSWGPDQTAQGTVRIVTSDATQFEEVEIRLRSSISAHSNTGYEINCSVKPGDPYLQINRWNRTLGSFTLLDGRGVGCANGDVLKGTASGSTISAYKNGVLIFSVNDGTYSSGSPGMGFFIQSGSIGSNADFGFSSFTATDGSSGPAALSITGPTSLSAGTVGGSYGPVTFAAAGGTGGYTWSATGLPSGLVLSTAGLLSGTPAIGSQGSYTPQFTVRDSSSSAASVALPLTISRPPLNITNPTSLSAGNVGGSYGPVTFNAAGGTGPYSWSATGLPSGLVLSMVGVLSGTPAVGSQGAYNPQFTVRDSTNTLASVVLPLTINAPSLSITSPTSLSAGTVGGSYGPVTFSASGGTGAYSWSANGLPSGTVFSTAGVLSGTPAIGSQGGYNPQFTVRDSNNTPVSVVLPLTINAPSLTMKCTPTFGPAQIGTAYSATCTASGGTPTYTWSISSGTLPIGLTMSTSTGTSLTISGTPTVGGNYSYTVRVTDLTSQAVTQPYSGTIIPGSAAISMIGSAANGTTLGAANQLVSIYGTRLGPATGSGAQVGGDGAVTKSNAGTQVFFDGVAAPILYASASQVNTAVPCAAAGRSSTQVIVTYQGGQSAAFTLPLIAAAPGVFTADGSGRGQAAALNQDYSLNGPTNPAVRGSAIALYATGIGVTSPCVDGQTYPTDFPKATLSVAAGVGGAVAQVLYAGQAPYFMAGVAQINISIPSDAPAGNVPLTLLVGGVFSPPGVTIAVR